LTHLPLREIGAHRVILFGEGQAPYDDLGFCVFEIDSLAGSPFAKRAPETARPDTWSESGDGEEEDPDE
jgi:hypothetical protein